MELVSDSEIQAVILPNQQEARSLLPFAGEQRIASMPKWRAAGLLLAGVGACAASVGLVTRAWPGALATGGQLGGLIQDDEWANCDVDWVIKKTVIDNLGNHDKSLPEGMRFEVERHGGGLPAERFLLDLKAPKIKDGDRSGHGTEHGSIQKLHLSHGHPLNIHFSLWDIGHTEKLTMENFGISFLDLDESKYGGHHEFVIAKPSMVTRVGGGLEVKAMKNGKFKFQATKFGLGEDDPAENSGLTDAQAAKNVRLLYSNVKEFVVSFGWTNPGHGIPREISFSLHDPAHCSDPLQAPQAVEPTEDDDQPSSEEQALEAEQEEAEEEKEAAEKATEKAEEQAGAAQDRADEAEAAQEELEDKADTALDQAEEAEEAQKEAEEAAKEAQKDAKADAIAAHREVLEAKKAQKKAEHALAHAGDKAHAQTHAALHDLKVSKHKEALAEKRAEAAQAHIKSAGAAKKKAEKQAKEALDAILAALLAKEVAIEDRESARIDVAAANEARASAESKADVAQDEVDAAQAKAQEAQKKADCAEAEAKANQKLRGSTKEQLEKMEAKIEDMIEATPAPCKGCEK